MGNWDSEDVARRPFSLREKARMRCSMQRSARCIFNGQRSTACTERSRSVNGQRASRLRLSRDRPESFRGRAMFRCRCIRGRDA
jgi:hypothetical protein